MGDFGFWILGILDFGDFGFRILGPESQMQNSPIQNAKSKLLLAGFWGFCILDFGSLCSNSLCEALNAPNFGFWWGILDFGFWGFWILDFGDFGFWILGILDFGFWILGILDFGDFGTLCSRSLCANFGFWILDFGDFGFWIFGDFGFWILEIFGVWGLGILDLDFATNFGFYIR